MTTTTEISNTDEVIDSRDVIARIEELEAEQESSIEDEHDGSWDNTDEAKELDGLRELAAEASDSPDWQYGEALIHEDYFTKHIEELIDDCYQMPKEMNSGDWPWRHVQIDYEAAAQEAKADYMEVDFDGQTYLIRA